MSFFRQCESVFSNPMIAYSLPLHSSGIVSMTSNNQAPQITYSTGTLWAEPVVVYWQSTDLLNFPSDYATSLMPKMGLSSVETASIGSGSRDATGTDAVAALKVGAIAGITIGCVSFAALLVGLVNCLCLRRRRQGQVSGTQQDLFTDTPDQLPAMRMIIGEDYRVELDARKHHAEVECRQAPIEIGSDVFTAIVELEAPIHLDPDKFSFTESQFDTRDIAEECAEGPFADEKKLHSIESDLSKSQSQEKSTDDT